MGIQHLIDTGGQQVTAILEKFLFIALSLSETKKRNKEEKEEEKGHTLTRTHGSPHSPAAPTVGSSRAVPPQGPRPPCWGAGRCEGEGVRPAGAQAGVRGRAAGLGFRSWGLVGYRSWDNGAFGFEVAQFLGCVRPQVPYARCPPCLPSCGNRSSTCSLPQGWLGLTAAHGHYLMHQ